MPSETDVAYLAGAFDGEGSIWIGLRNYGITKSRVRRRSWRLTCSVKTAGNCLPKMFHDCFGGSLYLEGTPSKGNYNVWHWTIQAGEALSFLKQVLPYLTVKKPQAEVGIVFQEKIQAKWNRNRRLGLTDEEKEEREITRLLLKQLKIQSYSDDEEE